MDENATKCPICISSVFDGNRWGVATPCGHPYHSECWNQVVAAHNKLSTGRSGKAGFTLLPPCSLCNSKPYGFQLVYAELGLGKNGTDDDHDNEIWFDARFEEVEERGDSPQLPINQNTATTTGTGSDRPSSDAGARFVFGSGGGGSSSSHIPSSSNDNQVFRSILRARIEARSGGSSRSRDSSFAVGGGGGGFAIGSAQSSSDDALFLALHRPGWARMRTLRARRDMATLRDLDGNRDVGRAGAGGSAGSSQPRAQEPHEESAFDDLRRREFQFEAEINSDLRRR